MKRRGLVLPLVGILALLAIACVSAPARRPEAVQITPPEQWTAPTDETESASGEVSPDWWTEFNDPALSEIIGIALESNRDLLAAAARVDRAAAEARIAGADLKPSIGVGASGSRGKQNFVGFPDFGGGGATGEVLSVTTSRFGVSLDVSWEIDLWGRLRAAARAGLANYQASEADYLGARLSIAGQTAKSWFAVAAARQQVELSEETVESWRDSYEQIHRRYREGLTSPLEVRLALANLEAAEADLETNLNLLDIAERQLEVILGRYPGRDLETTSALPELPGPVPAGLPADLVSRRPDLAAAERRLAATDEQVKFAKRSLYPQLSLTGSAGTSTAEFGDLVNGDFSVWNLGVNLLQPIFQGGRLRAQVKVAEAGSSEILELFASQALKAYAEVEIALASEGYLAGTTEHLGEAARQSVAAQRLAESRYYSGIEPYITVLESQRRAVVAQAAHINARRTVLDNRVDLYLALGGGFEVSDESPQEEITP
jgi:NodT family efflux transporter outer membrane factor (OMF) lipoprotein